MLTKLMAQFESEQSCIANEIHPQRDHAQGAK